MSKRQVERCGYSSIMYAARDDHHCPNRVQGLRKDGIEDSQMICVVRPKASVNTDSNSGEGSEIHVFCNEAFASIILACGARTFACVHAYIRVVKCATCTGTTHVRVALTAVQVQAT